jgi:hypothetical protein
MLFVLFNYIFIIIIIPHLLYFLHRLGWEFAIIICPLKASYKGNYGYKLICLVTMMFMTQAQYKYACGLNSIAYIIRVHMQAVDIVYTDTETHTH